MPRAKRDLVAEAIELLHSGTGPQTIDEIAQRLEVRPRLILGMLAKDHRIDVELPRICLKDRSYSDLPRDFDLEVVEDEEDAYDE